MRSPPFALLPVLAVLTLLLLPSLFGPQLPSDGLASRDAGSGAAGRHGTDASSPTRAEPVAGTEAPPPPFDWDPMWFNTDNASSSPADVARAAGAFTGLSVSDPAGLAMMFGGAVDNGSYLTDQTWIVNQTTAVWTLLHPHTQPSPREDFALSTEAACGVAVLFGGVVDTTSHRATNDTWLFNFTTLNWTNISGPVAPAPRQGAAIAVDNLTCQAVLYGGSDDDYRSGNSTGVVQWNDTWRLNLTTHVWTPIPIPHPPPSLTDSSLLFDNASGTYLLYGGCEGGLCSPDVWAFDPVARTWTLVTATNSVLPVGRGGASWVYSPTWDVAILNDGYELEGSTSVALNDTWVYLIDDNRFEEVGAPTPPPRYGAAGGWLSANGCPGFLIVGGGGAPTDPPDEWFLDPAPDIPLACNTWGNDSISTSGGGIGCDRQFQLGVTVVNSSSGLALPNATVTIAGNCSRTTVVTPANGTVDVLIAWQPYGVWANATDYHENYSGYTPTLPLLSGNLTIALTPLPTLVVRTFVKEINGVTAPLPLVTLTTGANVYLGTTNVSAVYVQLGYEPIGATVTFTANKTGDSTASVTDPVPYTGLFPVNLTLLGPGPVDVEVVETGGGALPGAVVTIAPPTGSTEHAVSGTTGPTGWVNVSLPANNYTAVAVLHGFARVGPVTPFAHPWDAPTVVVLNLTALIGYTVDARVFDSRTGAPLPGAMVQVGVFPPLETSLSGWANRTNITPAGTYGVLAYDENYSSNRTTVTLEYAKPIWIVRLNLTPLSTGCSGPGPGCTPANRNGTQVLPLTLFPSGPPAPALVYGGAALVLGIPAAYLWIARRRTPPVAPAEVRP